MSGTKRSFVNKSKSLLPLTIGYRHAKFLLPSMPQFGSWVSVKGVNGTVYQRDGASLGAVRGKEGVKHGSRWVVGKMRIFGFNKVSNLKEAKEMMVGQIEPG